MRLFPQLLRGEANLLASELSALTLSELVDRADVEHPHAIYDATGGQRMMASEMESLRDGLREIASRHGFRYDNPNESVELERPQAARLDFELAVFIHSADHLSPHQANRSGVWSFLGCVLVPELARWRFPGEKGKPSSPKRFTGYRLRNVLGRLWWRAHLFRDCKAEFPYWLVSELGEDELVQITERSNAAGYPALTREMGWQLTVHWNDQLGVNRGRLLRETMKRLLRWMTILRFELMDEVQLTEVVDDLFFSTMESMGLDVSNRPTRPPRLSDEWRGQHWQDTALDRRCRLIASLDDASLASLGQFVDPSLPDWGEDEPRWRMLFQVTATLGDILDCITVPSGLIMGGDARNAGTWLAEPRLGTWVKEVDPDRGPRLLRALRDDDVEKLLENNPIADAASDLFRWLRHRLIRRGWGDDWELLLDTIGDDSVENLVDRLRIPSDGGTARAALERWLIRETPRDQDTPATEQQDDGATIRELATAAFESERRPLHCRNELAKMIHRKPESVSAVLSAHPEFSPLGNGVWQYRPLATTSPKETSETTPFLSETEYTEGINVSLSSGPRNVLHSLVAQGPRSARTVHSTTLTSLAKRWLVVNNEGQVSASPLGRAWVRHATSETGKYSAHFPPELLRKAHEEHPGLIRPAGWKASDDEPRPTPKSVPATPAKAKAPDAEGPSNTVNLEDVARELYLAVERSGGALPYVEADQVTRALLNVDRVPASAWAAIRQASQGRLIWSSGDKLALASHIVAQPPDAGTGASAAGRRGVPGTKSGEH